MFHFVKARFAVVGIFPGDFPRFINVSELIAFRVFGSTVAYRHHDTSVDSKLRVL